MEIKFNLMIFRKSVKESFSIVLKEPLILIPGIISSAMASLILLIFSFDIAELNFSNLSFKFFNLFPVILLFISFNTFLTSLIIRATYEKKMGKIKFKRCFKKVSKQYFNAFFGFIFYAIISGIGLLAFIIPGIILMTKLFFYQVIILTEERGILYSFKKSWKLTKLHWKKVLFLVLIYLIIWTLLRILIIIPSIFSFYLYFLISLIFIPFYFVFITLTFFKIKATHTSKHQQD